MGAERAIPEYGSDVGQTVPLRSTVDGKLLVKPRTVEALLEEQNILLRQILVAVCVASATEIPSEGD